MLYIQDVSRGLKKNNYSLQTPFTNLFVHRHSNGWSTCLVDVTHPSAAMMASRQ